MKKPKKEKPQLVKVSYIECSNGNTIVIGQKRRDTEDEPVVWEYTILSPEGEEIHKGVSEDKYAAFNEAVQKATAN